MQCISYGVGSGLISNAVWKGVPLPTLLAQVQPKADTVAVLFHAADGFFETFPLSKANETTTLVAWEMNGEPLPPRHGFPMRMIVPGIYGERKPKWVTRLEFLAKDDPRLKINRHGIEGVGFYTEQGWGPNIFVPTTSRIDAPQVGGGDFAEPFKVGQPVELRGMAYGGDKGISKVEVSTDGGQTYATRRHPRAGHADQLEPVALRVDADRPRRRGARVRARDQRRRRGADRHVPRPGAARRDRTAPRPGPGGCGVNELRVVRCGLQAERRASRKVRQAAKGKRRKETNLFSAVLFLCGLADFARGFLLAKGKPGSLATRPLSLSCRTASSNSLKRTTSPLTASR